MWGLALRVGCPIRVSSVGRLRGAQVRSYRSRNESPPSSERESWPVPLRDERGQSTKMRFGSMRPDREPVIRRSSVVCGSAPRKCAETVVEGENARLVVVSNVTVGFTGGAVSSKAKFEGVVVES